MIYKKVKLEFNDAKERLSRTLLIKENTNLVVVGAIFCSALRTAFEHNYYFIKNKKNYSPDAFIKEGPSGLFDDFPMKKFTLKDLGASFTFIYDSGDYWDFDCKVSKKDVEVKGNKLAYLIDGKGQGIWEDNKYSLMAYINGEIDAKSNMHDEKNGYSLPWNFENNKYGDFDSFDIEEASSFFDSHFIWDVNDYLCGCHDYGYELEVKLIKTTKIRRAELRSTFGKKEDVEDLVINKTKTDMLSSLKNINKEYAQKYMEENCYDSYKEWKDSAIFHFKVAFDETKNHVSTLNFFARLMHHENTTHIVAYADDVTSNIVFLYRDNEGLKYYIPDEIKKIIVKELSEDR